MQRLIGFDGVRAIACLMVIIFHISQRMSPEHTPTWLSYIFNFTLSGYMGVSVFFVLSGALLSFPFWKAYINQTPMPKAKVYFLRRFARIVPGFYLSLTLSFLLAFTLFDATLDTQLIIRYLSGLLFLNEFHHVTLFPTEINDPLWSIGFEVFSYGLLFIVMLGLFKFLKNRTSSTVFYYLLFILCLTLVTHVCIYNFIPINTEGRGWEHGLTGGALTWVPSYNPISLFSHFLVGMIASAILVILLNKEKTAHIGIDLLLLLIWAIFYILPYINVIDIPYNWPVFPITIGITLICLPFSKLIARYLDNRFLIFTAKISFGLYIWHFLVMSLIKLIAFEKFEIFQTVNLTDYFICTALTFIFSYLIATLSFYYLESPIQKWSKRFN